MSAADVRVRLDTRQQTPPAGGWNVYNQAFGAAAHLRGIQRIRPGIVRWFHAPDYYTWGGLNAAQIPNPDTRIDPRLCTIGSPSVQNEASGPVQNWADLRHSTAAYPDETVVYGDVFEALAEAETYVVITNFRKQYIHWTGEFQSSYQWPGIVYSQQGRTQIWSWYGSTGECWFRNSWAPHNDPSTWQSGIPGLGARVSGYQGSFHIEYYERLRNDMIAAGIKPEKLIMGAQNEVYMNTEPVNNPVSTNPYNASTYFNPGFGWSGGAQRLQYIMADRPNWRWDTSGASWPVGGGYVSASVHYTDAWPNFYKACPYVSVVDKHEYALSLSGDTTGLTAILDMWLYMSEIEGRHFVFCGEGGGNADAQGSWEDAASIIAQGLANYNYLMHREYPQKWLGFAAHIGDNALGHPAKPYWVDTTLTEAEQAEQVRIARWWDLPPTQEALDLENPYALPQ